MKPDQRLKQNVLPGIVYMHSPLLWTAAVVTTITEKSSEANNQSSNIDSTYNKDVHFTDTKQLVDANPCNLKVGSIIKYGDPVQYGEIKWIGKLPDQAETFVGVEMVRHEMLTM